MLKLYFKPIILFILYIYEYINCKEYYLENSNDKDIKNPIICSSINPDIHLSKIDEKKTINIESKVINILERNVQTEFLNSSYVYELNLSNINNKDDLFVNFYPLDCQIEILTNDEEAITLKKISNYEYDAFSAFIQKNKKNSSYIKIKPLINPLDDKNIKRTYHLIINSFYKNNSYLIFNESYPTLIYFDLNLTKIKLHFKLNYTEGPIIISFYIKERNRFEVKILNNENQNRIIAYKDNIIIDPKQIPIKEKEIYISINNIDMKNCTMIVKVSGNNPVFYLQKNILNLGFMPINNINQYYYMEVSKGEEGEIMLNDKIHKGNLLHKIIEKKKNERDLKKDDFPHFNQDPKKFFHNQYNDFSKKLNFYSKETEICENGCYLLITYFSNIKLKNIDGAEYTLLTRIWDEDEFKTQIINIPLNEYIFGAIEPLFYSINAHYYSIFIPEDSDIIFEFQGRNIDALIKKGIVQINCLKKPYNSILLTNGIKLEEIEDEKLLIKLNKSELNLESFENQYFSFAFTIKFDDENKNTLINHYYFRIIQQNSTNNNIIYPLDTNKVNLCQTSQIDQNYVCYFILKNDYKELYNKFYIYAYGLEEVNYYNTWSINQIDYYSIDINNITKQYKNEMKTNDKGGYFGLFFKENVNFNYILLEIHSNYEEILEVLFNFGGEFTSPSLNIYSYQSFYLNTKENQSFNFNLSENKYTVVINNTSGNGQICLNQNCDRTNKKIFISGNIFLSFAISEEIKSIYFHSQKHLFFYLKIKNRMPNDVMEEINYGYSYKNITLNHIYSKAYYLKDIYGNGVDINFLFNFDNTSNYNNDIDNELLFYGFIFNYDDIKYINDYDSLDALLEKYLYSPNCFEGKYEPITKSGLITFDNIKKESFKKDLYYLFVFLPDKDITEFSVEIFIDSNKNESLFFLPKNKYIRGSFSLFNNMTIQSKTFYIQFEKEDDDINTNYTTNDTYILEFSSNLEIIKPIFNDNFNYDYKSINGGVQQYFFSIDKSKKVENPNFKIQMNNTINKYKEYDLPLNFANYVIKFYKEENELEFIMDKRIEFNRIYNKSRKISYYNFTIKNVKENSTNTTYDYEYTYYIHKYFKQYLYEFQLLNTTALIFNNDTNIRLNYDYEYKAKNPNEEFSFSLYHMLDNQIYILYILLKESNENNQEKYYSTFFQIDTKVENEDSDNNKKTIIILSLIFGSIFIITIVVSLIICSKYRKKNKNLNEQIKELSFSVGINEENINKRISKFSKEDEDYEDTFI